MFLSTNKGILGLQENHFANLLTLSNPTMPRKRSIKRTPRSSKKNQSKLPVSLQAFLARRLVDTCAIACFFAGTFLLLSLFTYNENDASWNNTGSTQVGISNIGGETGAILSDLFLQFLGGGSLLFAAALISWGLRLYYRSSISPIIARIPALILACFCASVALSRLPSYNILPHPYMGSSLGEIGFSALQSALPFESVWPLLLSSIVIGTLSFLYAAAFRREEVIGFVTGTSLYTLHLCIYTFQMSAAFISWVRHYNDDDYRPLTPAISMPELPKFQGFGFLSTEKQATRASTAEKPKAAPIAQIATPEPALPVPQERGQTNIPVVKSQTAQAPDTAPSGPDQARFKLTSGDWELPPVSLIETPPASHTAMQADESALRRNAELLKNVLADFNVHGDIVSIHPGPVVTLYELEPAPGTKTSRVISLADDIARSMSAVSVRCAVVPGRNVIGIELPNQTRQTVYMQELLLSRMFEKTKAKLPLILGKDIGGQPILADLSKMPHLLVAGTTGSGKSVAVNAMILSLLYCLPPEKCRFIMIDPKMLELSIYDDIPHLLSPVVTEPGKAVVALKWTVQEMEDRYRAMSKLGVRNIEGYNARMREAIKNNESMMRKVQTGYDPDTGKPIFEDQPIELAELPYIVVVVDEFADLMLVAGKDVENAIQRLAQMARAAGIHLIMATQRPSVDVITGVIKANFPTRISFSVTSKVDSRTILGEGGAEQLLGMGDMLYMAPGGRITRVHGPFVSDEDVDKVTNFLKEQSEPQYIDSITDDGDLGGSEVFDAMFGGAGGSGGDKVDELYDQAVALVAREGKASTSFVQRYLQIGYNRAARIIEEMERQGVISPASATGKRTVLVTDFSDA